MGVNAVIVGVECWKEGEEDAGVARSVVGLKE